MLSLPSNKQITDKSITHCLGQICYPKCLGHIRWGGGGGKEVRKQPSIIAIIARLRNHTLKPGFHYTANATTTTGKQSDYRVEESSFTLIALF